MSPSCITIQSTFLHIINNTIKGFFKYLEEIKVLPSTYPTTLLAKEREKKFLELNLI